MSPSPLAVLRRQFNLTWSLLEWHLGRLDSEDFLWEPGQHCWTVREGAYGQWWPDFAETEPEPVPVPTIAWITWHIDWWWTVTIDHVQGRTPRDRTEILWAGTGQAAVDRLRSLRAEWLAILDGLNTDDLDAAAPFPWRDDPERTLADTLAWVTAELMKNTAELGQLRLLRATAG